MSWKSAGDSPECSERPGGEVWKEQRVKVGSRVTGPKVGSQVRSFSSNKMEPLKTEQSIWMLSPHSGTSASGVSLFSNHFSLHFLSHQLEAQLGTCKPLKKMPGYLASKRSSQHESVGCYEPHFTSDLFPPSALKRQTSMETQNVYE